MRHSKENRGFAMCFKTAHSDNIAAQRCRRSPINNSGFAREQEFALSRRYSQEARLSALPRFLRSPKFIEETALLKVIQIAAFDEILRLDFLRPRINLRDILDKAIESLKPDYRTVFILRDIEELSTEETADVLDVNQQVVKTRLHRARARSARRSRRGCRTR